MIAIDIRQTKDRKIIVIHDNTVNRTTNGKGYVKDLTFSHIRQLDAGLGEKIPTLKEVIETVQGKADLIIELKEPGLESKTVDIIEKTKFVENVIVTSFIHQTLNETRKLNPAIRTGVIFKCAPLVPIHLTYQCGANILFPHYRYVTKEMIREAHKNETPLYVWTVDTTEESERQIKMGIDGIVTNNLNIRKPKVRRRKKVFIAGPIQGMERNQNYRKIIKRILKSKNLEIIDPWEREKIVYQYPKEDWWNTVPVKDFIKRDLADISRSDFFVAYLPKISAGTCMELFHAYNQRKHIFIISALDLSPWIVAHSTKIFSSFNKFESYLQKNKLI